MALGRGLHGEFLPALRPPPAQYQSSPLGGHADEEAVCALPVRVALVGKILFHDSDAPGRI